MSSRRLTLFLFLPAAVALLASCGRKQAAAPPPPSPASVEVYVTEQQTVPVAFDYIGQVNASQTVDVRSRITGVVLDQGFTEGTTVTKGQFLFRIDPRTFAAEVQVQQASLVQAKVNVAAALRELNRTRQLSATNTVSKEDLENAITKHNVAVAAQQLAEANVYKSQVELTYTTVTAPITGRIGRAEKRPGDLVDSGANSLLCTITAQDPAWIIFHMSEREMLDFKRDVAAGKVVMPEDGKLAVGVTLLDGTSYGPTGEINFFDVKINPQTGTALVRAELPNPEGTLLPGQFVKVHVRGTERPNLVLVPQKAVQHGMQGQNVLVVDEKKSVELRPVTLSKWAENNWIVESGLSAGEQVIIEGMMKARPGSTVDVTTVTRTLPKFLASAAHGAAAGARDQALPATQR